MYSFDKVDFFFLSIGEIGKQDKHAIQFPYMASVLADLQNESRKFKVATRLAWVSIGISILALLASAFHNCGIMTWSDVLALYAATLSTLVAFVALLRFVRETRSKIVVSLVIENQGVVFDDSKPEVWNKTLRVNIVNHSVTDRYISRPPALQINTMGKATFWLHSQTHFPKKLVPGEASEYLFGLKSIHTGLIESQSTKIRATATDTYGNHYYSNWESVSELIDSPFANLKNPYAKQTD